MFSADLGGITASSTPASNDPPFQKVALLLHGDGTNGAQNNTFVDGSSNNFSITRTGNVAQGTFSPFSLPEGQWSNYFDGTTDYLSIPTGSSTAFGTGDFTVECFMYANAYGSDVWIFSNIGASGSTNWGLEVYGGNIRFTSYNTVFLSATQPSLNAWHHIAVSRSGTTLSMFVDGTRVATATNSTDFSLTNNAIIGAWYNGGLYAFNGHISNARAVNGTAVYDPTQTTLTVPTAPLTAISGTSLLTCQSNRFKDNSSNNFTITRNGDTKVTAFSPFAPSATYSASTNGGSAYFDGSGDYLSAPNDTSLQLSGNQFTIEGWFYLASVWLENYLLFQGSSSNDNNINWLVRVTSTNKLRILIMTSGETWYYLDSTATVSANQWYHFATVCDGSGAGATLKSWLNGVYQGTSGSFNATNINTNAASTQIGSFSYGSNYTNGYISNVRILKGTALYTGTSNITVPTAPLTAITNTSLLLNCTNAGIFDNAGKNDIETVGNAQISTSVKKYGTGSMYFDGTGDYLVMSPSPNFTFGTGDFTVECWVYISAATPTANGIFQQGTSSFPASTTNTVAFGTVTSGSVWQIYAKNTNTNSTATWTTNTWYHAAVVRYSGTTKLYINGTAVITVTSDTTNYTGTYFGIGAIYGATPYNHNGYIDDLRITKGQALYTANFTPPTQAFPDV